MIKSGCNEKKTFHYRTGPESQRRESSLRNVSAKDGIGLGMVALTDQENSPAKDNHDYENGQNVMVHIFFLQSLLAKSLVLKFGYQ